eukprot:2377108-Rhodomonas_salina.1
MFPHNGLHAHGESHHITNSTEKASVPPPPPDAPPPKHIAPPSHRRDQLSARAVRCERGEGRSDECVPRRGGGGRRLSLIHI